ncbi:MAG: dihydroneopterin aldolase [Candidatus Omnitrophica bacterium]|nr:dihydroneopterin aldolase [Candidatus Omnitrophota bacterium]
MIATIQIKDLALKAVIGIHDHEHNNAQDIMLNISLEYDAANAVLGDDIKDAVDYQAIQQAVITLVAATRFNLVERLAAEVLKVVTSDPRVLRASVTIDKPKALSSARSVSLTMVQGGDFPNT